MRFEKLCTVFLAFLSIGANGRTFPNHVPGGMFELYSQNRSMGVGNLITKDFLGLSYTMCMDHVGELAETRILEPKLNEVILSLHQKLQNVPASPERELSLRFTTVLIRLVQDGGVAADQDDHAVKQELQLIRSASGEDLSPIIGGSLDYSQFRTRGRYGENPDLAHYFRASMYASGPLFRFTADKHEASQALADLHCKAAFLMATLIDTDKAISQSYEHLNETLAFLYGKADDLSLNHLMSAVHLYNPQRPDISRERLIRHFVEQKTLPQIAAQSTEKDELLLGWRLLPKRFNAESAFFQKVVYGNVGQRLEPGFVFTTSVINGKPMKGFPMCAELMSALGSEHATSLVKAYTEDSYEGYPSARAEAEQALQSAEGVSKGHLDLLRLWLDCERDP